MQAISSWAANTEQQFVDLEPHITISSEGIDLEVYLTNDSLWLSYGWINGARINFRAVFEPAGSITVTPQKETNSGFSIDLESTASFYHVEIQFPEQGELFFRYTTTITPKIDLLLPYTASDILPLDKNGKIKLKGTIHTQQTGTRSGILFFNDGEDGSVFYFQNLTALNDYCQATETSAGGVVGSSLPEIGFSLPSSTDKPLKKGTSYVISDAFVRLAEVVSSENSKVSKSFLNHLAETYVVVPHPERHYHNWLDTVEKGLNDLLYHKGCWTFAGGHNYLNAYVADYKSPPEVMVQLAVLLPMVEYIAWKGEKDHMLITQLKEGLSAFYQDDMKTIVRWLPSLEEQLDYSEEQKQPRVMDSWYLHHPIMNLARLASHGDKEAKKLLLNSIDYVIRVAQTFDYEWPVFYQMDTLKILKAETAEGEGGEQDVPGSYADIMLRVWEITGEKKYFDEAVTSAGKLKDLGFDIFYQANNTAFAAGAMLRLYKETKDETYLNISYDCLAGIFNNVQLWECDYGLAKHFPTFFSVFPLKDAPYTAAYEEQEVYAALHDYLKEAENVEILPSIRLLIAEFIRHMIGRVAYYYPPMLPEEAFTKKAKTGEVDPKLWIALEDLHDGWEQSGEVGQEVYGAGIAFGIIPRQYFKLPIAGATLFCDYPIAEIKITSKSAKFRINGDPRLKCRILLLIDDKDNQQLFQVISAKKQLETIKQTDEVLEFSVSGGQQLQITWASN
jgi:hypothetical protein